MKRIITMVALLLALAASVYSALTFNGKVSDLTRENKERVEQARRELEEEKNAYAAIDPSTDEGMAHQIDAENEAIAAAQEKTQQLQQENEDIRTENEELEREITALESEEETAYYLTVYNSLRKGMELVEGCIDGE